MGSFSRRGVFGLALMSALAACSRPSVSTAFSVNVAVIPRLLEAVVSFANARGFEAGEIAEPPAEVAEARAFDLWFEGRWSEFSFYRPIGPNGELAASPGNFVAEFRHHDEIIFPHDNLETWLAELIVAVEAIEGVYQ